MNAPRRFLFVLRVTASAAALAAAGLAFAADAAPGNVTVAFSHPENFTDLKQGRYPDAQTTDAYMADLRHYIEQRATDAVGPDRKLEITITDVDMAGQIEPTGPRNQPIRVLHDAEPPTIDLVFKVTDAGGQVLKSGERHLSDLAFQNPVTRTANTPLYFEKRMLSDWLSGELGN